ncbi:MAG: lectin-like protein, partial [Cyanobium sp.]
ETLLGGYGHYTLQVGGGQDSRDRCAGNDVLNHGDQTREDPNDNPSNGHWYQYVSAYRSWSQARDAAALSQLDSLNGYLVTITSEAEQAFINNTFGTLYYTWIGASDADSPGNWTWVTGPENGLVFTIVGGDPTGEYSNWWSGQPQDSGSSANRAMALNFSNNAWYAVSDGYYSNGYIVEYGAPGDSSASVRPPGDVLKAGAGDDYLYSRGGNDSIDGGDGYDRLDLDFTRLSQGLTLLIDDPTITTTLSNGGTITGIEEFTIRSGSGNDHLRAGAGNDNLQGGDGNDTLEGGAGYDYLYGGNGDDLIYGGISNDWLSGGNGMDRFVYQSPDEGLDQITDFQVDSDYLAVSASGFGGGLMQGMDIMATDRYVESAAGVATSDPGVGQFIYQTSTNQLLWDGDGSDVLTAIPLVGFGYNPIPSGPGSRIQIGA